MRIICKMWWDGLEYHKKKRPVLSRLNTNFWHGLIMSRASHLVPTQEKRIIVIIVTYQYDEY